MLDEPSAQSTDRPTDSLHSAAMDALIIDSCKTDDRSIESVSEEATSKGKTKKKQASRTKRNAKRQRIVECVDKLCNHSDEEEEAECSEKEDSEEELSEKESVAMETESTKDLICECNVKITDYLEHMGFDLDSAYLTVSVSKIISQLLNNLQKLKNDPLAFNNKKKRPVSFWNSKKVLKYLQELV
jgi:hypothetical protein